MRTNVPRILSEFAVELAWPFLNEKLTLVEPVVVKKFSKRTPVGHVFYRLKHLPLAVFLDRALLVVSA